MPLHHAIILFDADDGHSMTMATSIAYAHKALREDLQITLLDSTGHAFRPNERGGGFWEEVSHQLGGKRIKLPDLVQTLMENLGIEPMLLEVPNDFHWFVFDRLTEAGVIRLGGENVHNPSTLEDREYEDPPSGESTTVDAAALTAIIGDELDVYLDSVVEGTEDVVCYAMPPCGFDRVPVYLLDFAHKLRKSTAGGTFDYCATGAGGQVAALGRVPARPAAAPMSALRALVDVALCRRIHDRTLGFFGTCHGAQAMWLALGERLTRHSRVDVAHEATTPHRANETGLELQVSRGGATSTAPGGAHASVTVEGLTYSTDFNHEHFMLLPTGRRATATWIQEHVLSGLTFAHEGTIMTDPTDRASRKLLKKKDRFCQAFSVGGIRCYQDHPHYHVKAVSDAQSGKDLANNPHNKEAAAIVNQMWR